MACSIAPILMDTDCPKEGVFAVEKTLWGKVQRVERRFQKGTIYMEGQITFHVNANIPRWIMPGIRIEVNIDKFGTVSMQQIEQ